MSDSARMGALAEQRSDQGVRMRVGIVGAGSIVRGVHLPVLKATANIQIAWITDANAKQGGSVGEAYGVPFVALPDSPGGLPDCDVVLIAVPVAARPAYYEHFAQRGTAVFAEKPFAICADDHLRHMHDFEQHRVGCGYMRRMYASHRLLRKIVRERWFGDLRGITISNGGRATKTGFDQTFQDLGVSQGGGVLLNIGSHAIDSAFFVTEASGYSVSHSNVVWDEETDRQVEAHVTLRGIWGNADQNCDLHLCVSWLDNQRNTIDLEFDSVKVSAGIAPGEDVTILGKSGDERLSILRTTELAAAVTTNQAFFLEWDAFLRGVRAGKASEIAASHSLVTAQMMDDLLARRNVRGRFT